MLKKTIALFTALSFYPVHADAQYSDILSKPAKEVEVVEEAIEAPQEGAVRNTVINTESFSAIDESDISGPGRNQTIEATEEGYVIDGELVGEADGEVDMLDELSSFLTGDTFIELSNVYQDFMVKPGTTFDVVLMAEPSRVWNFDASDVKTVELAGTNTDGDLTIYTFKAVNEGFERLYFDYIDHSNDTPSVVESRMLDLSVGTPGAKTE